MLETKSEREIVGHCLAMQVLFDSCTAALYIIMFLTDFCAFWNRTDTCTDELPNPHNDQTSCENLQTMRPPCRNGFMDYMH